MVVRFPSVAGRFVSMAEVAFDPDESCSCPDTPKLSLSHVLAEASQTPLRSGVLVRTVLSFIMSHKENPNPTHALQSVFLLLLPTQR